MSNVRFTAWMTERERAGLEEAARREEGTLNFIMRKALRAYLNDVHKLHVTSANTDKDQRI